MTASLSSSPQSPSPQSPSPRSSSARSSSPRPSSPSAGSPQRPGPSSALGRAAPAPRGLPQFEPVRVRQARWYRLRRTLRKRRRVTALGLVATAAVAVAVTPPPAPDERTAKPPSPAPPLPLAGPHPGEPAAPPGPSNASRPPGSARAPAHAGPSREHGQPSGDTLAAPVRLADPGVVRLLRRGDLVDVLAAPAPGWVDPLLGAPTPEGGGTDDVRDGPAAPPPASAARDAEGAGQDQPDDHPGPTGGDPASGARVIARAARVTEVPKQRESAPGEGALVVLSVPRKTATALVSASLSARLAVVRR